jgi:DNA-binding transcriptional LysR family regulator
MTPPRAPPTTGGTDKGNVNLHRLRYFVAVCDYGGLSRAAAAIGVAQPALTRQIQLLEDEVGQPLLKRSGRGARPSEAGRFLLERSRGHLEGLDEALRELRENVAGAAGPLTLGICPSIAPFFLKDLVAYVAELYPRVALSVIEAYSGDLRSLMEAGRIDLTLTYSGAAPEGFTSADLITERLVLVGGRPAFSAPVTVSDVARTKLVLPSRIHELRAIIDRVSAKRGVELSPAIELDSLGAVKDLLLDKLAGWLTILPFRSVQSEAEAGLLTATPFDNPDMRRTIALVAPCEPRNPAAAKPVAAWIVRRASALDPAALGEVDFPQRARRASTANLRGSTT